MDANKIIDRIQEAIMKIHAEANKSLEILNEKAEKNHQNVINPINGYPGMYNCDESYLREIARYAWAARAKKISMYEMNDIKKELETELMKTTTLYRPVNRAEFDLIAKTGFTRFPPRLPQQPIFYPVTNLEYALDITTKWNIPAYGEGYVMKFQVNTDYLNKFDIHNVGGFHHNEYWIPAEQLEEFNDNIIGTMKVITVSTNK
jgi:hypothetical protein